MTEKNTSKNSSCMNLRRRDFICKSAVVCCMAPMPFAVWGRSRTGDSSAPGPDVNPGELTSYCGLYCGACDIYQKRIAKAGNDLKQVLDAFDFKEISKQVPGLEDYDSFEKVLNILIMYFGQCPSCRKGGGNPSCPARSCCKDKGYQTCAECATVPCEKLEAAGVLTIAEKNLKEIKETGLDKWARQQQDMVDKGFRYSESRLSEKDKK